MLQIGDAGGIETSVYESVAWSGAVGGGASVAGFYLQKNTSAAHSLTGSLHIDLENSSNNTWVLSGTPSSFANTGGQGTVVSGRKSLSAELDRIRLTTVGGSDTFDAGEVNISYE
jgi:hypothetical protein